MDGIFLDMCWDQPSVSQWAVEGMLRCNLDPRLEEHRARYARQVALDYMRRFSARVEAAGKGADHFGIWFNSRPKTNLHVERQFLRRVEIEALPTGGWGYAYFPYVARFVRPLGLPTLTHTGRFFKSWGDNAGLKPPAALKYECCQVLSQGMTGGIGDLLHPRGMPQPAVYELIGSAYAHLEACEPFVAGGTLQSQIALIVDRSWATIPAPPGWAPPARCSSSSSSSTWWRPTPRWTLTSWCWCRRPPPWTRTCARRCAATWRRAGR